MNKKLLINKLNSSKYIDKTTNPKIEFRFICSSHLTHIRNIILPDFCENSNYESVLVEYRCFPHLEFLIRNTILKLSNKWSHTIVLD